MGNNSAPAWEPIPENIQAWLDANRLVVIHRDQLTMNARHADRLAGKIGRLSGVVDKLPNDAAALASAFHEAYERLAPSFGYQTREETKTPWRSLPPANKKLMIAVAQEIIDGYLPGAAEDDAVAAIPAAVDRVIESLVTE